MIKSLQQNPGDPYGAFIERFSDAVGERLIAVKDNFSIRGFRPTAGIGGESFSVAPDDAFVVQRWREKGGGLAGRTRMDEGALGALGFNPFHGRTENPRALGYSPGGSSSGSAAAVASGIVRIALGTDTMGSVRIPASYCGIVGFKPSRGVLSLSGVIPLSPTLDHVGVLGIDVRSIEEAFGILAAPDSNDRYSRNLPRLEAPLTTLPRELVVAVPRNLVGANVEPQILSVFGRVCEAINSEIFPVVTAPPMGFLGQRMRKAAFLLAEIEGAAVHADLVKDAQSGLSPSFRRLLEYGRDLPSSKGEHAYQVCNELAQESRLMLTRFDFILTPTTLERAFRHGNHPPPGQADLTVFANAAGLPAISLPLPMPDGERPAGLQIVGRDLADLAVLELALEIEALVQRI